MSLIKLYDLPTACWPKLFDQGTVIDRSGMTADDYLAEKNYRFVSKPEDADFFIRKADISEPQFLYFEAEQNLREQLASVPHLLLLGEPRYLSPAAYRFAQTENSLAVAPGDQFSRMYFARPWSDPQIESWSKRSDRFCWIGKPWPHRVEWAKKLVAQGIELDIYSREPWPLSQWKGPAQDDVETARAYKFRIVCENSMEDLYHSEKLFVGMKSGNICFYLADPALKLPSSLDGTHLILSDENLKLRYEMASKILEKMNQFLFSTDWEIYSLRAFIDRIDAMIEKVPNRRQPLPQ